MTHPAEHHIHPLDRIAGRASPYAILQQAIERQRRSRLIAVRPAVGLLRSCPEVQP